MHFRTFLKTQKKKNDFPPVYIVPFSSVVCGCVCVLVVCVFGDVCLYLFVCGCVVVCVCARGLWIGDVCLYLFVCVVCGCVWLCARGLCIIGDVCLYLFVCGCVCVCSWFVYNWWCLFVQCFRLLNTKPPPPPSYQWRKALRLYLY